MHINDPLLLAFLDGELGLPNRASIRIHLCWCSPCRARFAELQAKSNWFAQALLIPDFTESQIGAAKGRFSKRLDEADIPFEMHREKNPAFLNAFSRAGGRLAFGAALLIGMSAFALWRAGIPAEHLHAIAMPAKAKLSVLPSKTNMAPAPLLRSNNGTLPAPQPISEVSSVAPFIPFDADNLEAQLVFALHEARSCLGEQIEVSRDGEKRLLVHGIVDSVQRKQEIISRLAEIAASPFVNVSLSTVEESSNETRLPETLNAGNGPELRENTSLRRSDELLLFLKSKEPNETPAELQRRISSLSNSAVRRMNSALLEAWAVDRLSRQFPSAKMHRLSPASQGLVEQMAREHWTDLEQSVAGVGRLLEMRETAVVGADLQCVDWRTRASEILGVTRESHERSLQLFASYSNATNCSGDCVDRFQRELKELLTLIASCSR